jgi:hypothetical protein
VLVVVVVLMLVVVVVVVVSFRVTRGKLPSLASPILADLLDPQPRTRTSTIARETGSCPEGAAPLGRKFPRFGRSLPDHLHSSLFHPGIPIQSPTEDDDDHEDEQEYDDATTMRSTSTRTRGRDAQRVRSRGIQKRCTKGFQETNRPSSGAGYDRRIF